MSNPITEITRRPPFWLMPLVAQDSDCVTPDGKTSFQRWLDDHEWIDGRGRVVARGYHMPKSEAV